MKNPKKQLASGAIIIVIVVIAICCITKYADVAGDLPGIINGLFEWLTLANAIYVMTILLIVALGTFALSAFSFPTGWAHTIVVSIRWICLWFGCLIGSYLLGTIANETPPTNNAVSVQQSSPLVQPVNPYRNYAFFLGPVLSTVALVTTFLLYRNTKEDNEERRRIDNTLAQVEYYFHDNFAVIRHAVWRRVFKEFWLVRRELGGVTTKNEIVAYLFPDYKKEDANDRLLPFVDPLINDKITPLQAMVYFISFWDRLAVMHKANMVKTELLEPLNYQFACWHQFLTELAGEVRAHTVKSTILETVGCCDWICKYFKSRPKEKYPSWVDSISYLDTKVFSGVAKHIPDTGRVPEGEEIPILKGTAIRGLRIDIGDLDVFVSNNGSTTSNCSIWEAHHVQLSFELEICNTRSSEIGIRDIHVSFLNSDGNRITRGTIRKKEETYTGLTLLPQGIFKKRVHCEPSVVTSVFFERFEKAVLSIEQIDGSAKMERTVYHPIRSPS